MHKTWFVGAGAVGPPPALVGDRLVPLSVVARSLLPNGGETPLDLEALELEAGRRVLEDLTSFARPVRSQIAGERWLRYDGRDLSPAFRRPDEAVVGFANQATAFQIASASSRTGSCEAWGVDPYQLAGLRAALGEVKRSDSTNTRISVRPRALLDRFAPRPSCEAGPCDILYLSLEPHVALQQDRVLRLLAEDYRIVPVSLSRAAWTWPEAAVFRPPTHTPLIHYLRFQDVMKEASVWMALRATRAFQGHPLPWMHPTECVRWIRSTWLRAASVADALARAIDTHRPRMLIGTNLASGVGSVISSCAAERGVVVLSLPTGADYLLPPSFDPADAGSAIFVVPGEGIAERLRRAGVPGERILPCGWPELDSIVSVSPAEVAALREEFAFGSDRRLAVFFSSPSTTSDELVVPSQAKRRGFELLAKACEMEGLQLVVKLHPRETDDTIEQMAAQLRPPALVLRDRLPALIHAADVVASIGSAVSFAGAALGKTTVILEASSICRTAALFATVGVGAQPRSLEELRSLLRGAAGPRADGGGNGFLGADGKVAERIQAAVNRLLD